MATHPRNNLLDRARRFLFGYDAAVSSPRRRQPTVRLISEDAELPSGHRRALLGGARDTARNFTVCAWAIRQHLNYVSSFKFQARTNDDGLNRDLESLVETWSGRKQSDRAGRHNFHRALRMAEARRTVDGDILAVKLSDGRLQWIEAERVGSPTLSQIQWKDGHRIIHGVEVDDAGAALSYQLCRRTPEGLGLIADGEIPAQNAILYANWDAANRFDATRGISPIAAALNAYRDLYESLDYALAKAKIAQLFGLAFYRTESDSLPGTTPVPDADADGGDDPRYNIDFSKGPIVLDLDPGDRAEFLESKQPSTEFQAYASLCIAIALKSLDIPYCFFDETKTNYSGTRQAWIQYDCSAELKRRDVRELLDEITEWLFALKIAKGDLKLPRRRTLADLNWEWVAIGQPWIDPLKEAQADALAIGQTLTSRSRVCKQRGEEWREIVDEIAAENAYLTSRGLPLPPAFQNPSDIHEPAGNN